MSLNKNLTKAPSLTNSQASDVKNATNSFSALFAKLLNSSLTDSNKVIDESTDWNTLSNNEFYSVNSFKGQHAPTVLTGKGVTLVLGNDKDNTKIAFSNNKIAIQRPDQTWDYIGNSLTSNQITDLINTTLNQYNLAGLANTANQAQQTANTAESSASNALGEANANSASITTLSESTNNSLVTLSGSTSANSNRINKDEPIITANQNDVQNALTKASEARSMANQAQTLAAQAKNQLGGNSYATQTSVQSMANSLAGSQKAALANISDKIGSINNLNLVTFTGELPQFEKNFIINKYSQQKIDIKNNTNTSIPEGYNERIAIFIGINHNNEYYAGFGILNISYMQYFFVFDGTKLSILFRL